MEKRKAMAVDLFCIAVGTFLTAAGMVVFTIPNHLAPGGVSGLATALASVMPVSVGVLSLLLNIPIFLIAWRMFGFRKLLLTGVASVALSLLLDLLAPCLPAYTGNRLLAAAFGGVLCGAGLGLLFIRSITTGGTDLIVMILRKPFPTMASGTLLVLVDAIVVLIAVLIFRDIEVALYSAVTIYVQGKVIDALLQGVDYAKVILIITDKPAALLAVLADEMGRGVTEFTARGGYTRENKSMLMTVARRSEVAKTLQVVQRIDPGAFTILHNATEVRGEGFKEETL